MENNPIQTMRPTEPTPPIQLQKKWYKDKVVLTLLILVIVAAASVAVYFILNQPLNYGPIGVPHQTKSVSQGQPGSWTIATSTEGGQFNKSSLNQNASSSLSQPQNIPIASGSWIPYRSPYLGMQLKYPANWFVINDYDGGEITLSGPTAKIHIFPSGATGSSDAYVAGLPLTSSTTIGGQAATENNYPNGYIDISLNGPLPRWASGDNAIQIVQSQDQMTKDTVAEILSSINFFTPVLSVDTSSWNSYNSYGTQNGISYQLQFPVYWTQQQETNPTFASFSIGDGSGGEIYFTGPGLSLKQYSITATQSISIGGQSATQIIGCCNGPDTSFSYITFDDPSFHDYISVFMNFPSENQNYYIQSLDQILSTFQFNHVSTDTTTWQTYDNSDMGIQLLVPQGWNARAESATATLISDSINPNTSVTQPEPNDSFVLVEANQNCVPTNSFSISNYGPSTLTEIVCSSGLKFTLGLWAKSYDKANTMQALEEIPTTLELIQAGQDYEGDAY